MKIVKNRLAKSNLDAESFYSLISDLRNFRLFIPSGLREKYRADETECSLDVDNMGTLSLKLTGKEPFSTVTYTGSLLSRIDMVSEVGIRPLPDNSCEANILFTLETDTFTGMFISSAIDGFLDKLVSEIENYAGPEKG